MRTLILVALTPAILVGGATAHANDSSPPELFVTSDRCMACHNGLVTPEGQDASIGVDWRSSMMANAARDPYWQAAIRREALVHPTARAAIEDKCGSCHMSMTRYQAKANGQMGEVFAHLPIVRASGPDARLAADGVSCALCHQIQNQQLGDKESFTAGFVIDETTAPGRRAAYGPFDVDPGRTTLMQSASRFLPTRADHLNRSELCATCHTVYTHALNSAGEDLGEFPEQVPYLEWRHSEFYGVRSCQSCHMPVVAGKMPITGVMGVPREEVSLHVFRGGNFFMPRMLNRYRGELGVPALPQELETTSSRTAEHLQRSAAQLAIEQVDVAGGTLRATVRVVNQAGHKLPSAYPSRRVWLHFMVRDAAGNTLFDSGRFNANGSIAGNDNDDDQTREEPHYLEIDAPDQVQIYESIMADSEGMVTTVLLSAIRYTKDNRLLPSGFEKATAERDIAVHGRATEDDDFVGGADRVRYAVDLAGDSGPFTIEAELWYQPVAYRWAQNLRQQQAEEIERFVAYYDSLADSSAMVLARDEVVAP
jgi:hypothetical protein